MSIFGTPQTQGFGAGTVSSQTSGNFNTAVGDFIVVGAYCTSTHSFSVSDSAGNVYRASERIHESFIDTTWTWFFSRATNASATNQITVTLDSSAAILNVFVWDFPISGGVPVYDDATVTLHSQAFTGSPVTSASFNTTGVDELILTNIYDPNNHTDYSGGSGYTFDGNYGAFNRGDAQHGTFTSPGSGVTATMPYSGSPTTRSVAIGTIAFKLQTNTFGPPQVQGSGVASGSSTAPPSVNTAVGDLIVVQVIANNSTAVQLTVSDSAGNTYRTCARQNDVTNLYTEWFWSKATNASATNTITASSSASVTILNAIVWDFPLTSGSKVCFDFGSQTGKQASPSGNELISNTLSTSGAEEILLVTTFDASGRVMFGGPGFTFEGRFGSSNTSAAEHRIFNSTQSSITVDMGTDAISACEIYTLGIKVTTSNFGDPVFLGGNETSSFPDFFSKHFDVPAGDLLVVAISTSSSNTASVSDTGGSSFTDLINTTGAGQKLQMSYSLSSVAQIANRIHLVASTSLLSNTAYWTVPVLGGIPSVDVTGASVFNVNTNPFTDPTYSTTGTDDVVFICSVDSLGGSPPTPSGAGPYQFYTYSSTLYAEGARYSSPQTSIQDTLTFVSSRTGAMRELAFSVTHPATTKKAIVIIIT